MVRVVLCFYVLVCQKFNTTWEWFSLPYRNLFSKDTPIGLSTYIPCIRLLSFISRNLHILQQNNSSLSLKMDFLPNTSFSVVEETDDISECLRFKHYLLHKYETTDRLQYQCAANIMRSVINNKIDRLKTFCREKLERNKFRNTDIDFRLSADDISNRSNIGMLSKSMANLSKIFNSEDNGEDMDTTQQTSNKGYPRRVVRQLAKTITLTMSEPILINIPAEWIIESKQNSTKIDQPSKNINYEIVGNIVKTFLKT